SKTTTCPNGCSRATGGRIWKRCSSTSRAAAFARRPRNDHARYLVLLLPRRRDGAALLVSFALVLAAAARPDLLADGADADVGVPADVCRAERGLLRARRRRIHWLRPLVGHPVPRPARIFNFLPGGDVGAQPRQHHDLSSASGRK